MEALFNLILSTGFRPGEALALRWEDLDLQRGRLVAQRALIERAKGSYVIGPNAFSRPRLAHLRMSS